MKRILRLFLTVMVGSWPGGGSPRCAGATWTNDFSSPEATYRTCGLAIRNNEPQTFYKAIILGEQPLPYEDFRKGIWNETDAEGRRTYGGHFRLNKTLQPTNQVAGFFLAAQFLRETQRQNTDGAEIREYLVKWPHGQVFRTEVFYRLKREDHWRWFLNPFTRDVQAHESYATPADAYRAIAQAQQLKLATNVYRGLAAAARSGKDVAACVQQFHAAESQMSKRKRDHFWSNREFWAAPDCLKEEPLPDKDGQHRCRVWELTKDPKGKTTQRSSKLFVQEGAEWKWLPDTNSVWHSKIGPLPPSRLQPVADP